MAWLFYLGLTLLLASQQYLTASVPSWVSLCGHQYLFSEYTHNWYDARDECRLYGGYLAKIENLHENNCLIKHAMDQGKYNYWWQSGNNN